MLRMMWVLFLVLFLAPMQAAGAVIERIEGHPEGCTLMVSGLINIGDAEALEGLIAAWPWGAGTEEKKVCFHSEGGNWTEGVNIALTLYENRVPTHIPENSVCLSACAIAFLGGTQNAEEGSTMRSRSMHSTSTLGFHSVSLNVEEGYEYEADHVEQAFRVALDAVSLIYSNVDILRVDPSFVNRFLQVHGREEFMYIDSIEMAEHLGLDVTGVNPTVFGLDRARLRALCFESFRYSTDYFVVDADPYAGYFVSDVYPFSIQSEGVSGRHKGIFIASNGEGYEQLSLCFYRQKRFGYDLHTVLLGSLGIYNHQRTSTQRMVEQLGQGADISSLVSTLLDQRPEYFGGGLETISLGARAYYDPSTRLEELYGEGVWTFYGPRGLD